MKNNSKSDNILQFHLDSSMLQSSKIDKNEENPYENDSPFKRRRRQQTVMKIIDKDLRRRETFRNNFGLDFSLMDDPNYNPTMGKSK